MIFFVNFLKVWITEICQTFWTLLCNALREILFDSYQITVSFFTDITVKYGRLQFVQISLLFGSETDHEIFPVIVVVLLLFILVTRRNHLFYFSVDLYYSLKQLF